MKSKSMWILIVMLGFYSCGEKKPVSTVAQQNKPVVSVLDQGQQKKNEKSDSAVLESPKFTPKETSKPAAATTAIPAKDSPKATIQNYTEQLQALQSSSVKGKERDTEIADKVRKFFDFNTLARLSLGNNWDKLSAKKKDEYTKLFTQLIEKSYLRRSRSLVSGYQVNYGNEKISGNEATVSCNVSKEDADVEILYELHKVSVNWMIYNVIFDQVNLVKNYQTQFNQIIAKTSIDGLMNTMRKKLNEDTSNIDSMM